MARSCAESLASQKNVPIPDELTVHERDCETGLWDIMQISVLRKFRGTYATAWLQHALYKASCDVEGAARWIANMTRRESRTLRALGIPVRDVHGLLGTDNWVTEEMARTFAFQTVDVRECRSSVSARIGELLAEADHGHAHRFALTLANVASIGLDGRLAVPIGDPRELR